MLKGTKKAVVEHNDTLDNVGDEGFVQNIANDTFIKAYWPFYFIEFKEFCKLALDSQLLLASEQRQSRILGSKEPKSIVDFLINLYCSK